MRARAGSVLKPLSVVHLAVVLSKNMIAETVSNSRVHTVFLIGKLSVLEGCAYTAV